MSLRTYILTCILFFNTIHESINFYMCISVQIGAHLWSIFSSSFVVLLTNCFSDMDLEDKIRIVSEHNPTLFI